LWREGRSCRLPQEVVRDVHPAVSLSLSPVGRGLCPPPGMARGGTPALQALPCGAGWNPRPTITTVRRGVEPAPYKRHRPARDGTRALQAPPFGAGWNTRPTSATVRRGVEPAPYKRHRSARDETRALQAPPCGAGWNPRPTSTTVRRGMEPAPYKRGAGCLRERTEDRAGVGGGDEGGVTGEPAGGELGLGRLPILAAGLEFLL